MADNVQPHRSVIVTDSARCTQSVPAGEILLRAPAGSNLPDPAYVLLSDGMTLEGVLAAISQRYEQTLGNGGLITKAAVVSIAPDLDPIPSVCAALPRAALLRKQMLLLGACRCLQPH